MLTNAEHKCYFGEAAFLCSNIAALARTPAADEADPVDPPAEEGGPCMLIGRGPLVAPLRESGFLLAEEPVELRRSEADEASGLSSSTSELAILSNPPVLIDEIVLEAGFVSTSSRLEASVLGERAAVEPESAISSVGVTKPDDLPPISRSSSLLELVGRMISGTSGIWSSSFSSIFSALSELFVSIFWPSLLGGAGISDLTNSACEFSASCCTGMSSGSSMILWPIFLSSSSFSQSECLLFSLAAVVDLVTR